MKTNISTLIYPLIIMGFGVIIINGCKKSNNTPTASTSVDYSQAAHWLSLPATIYKADVFYLYPTTSWTKNNSTSMICAIDDSLMMAGASQALPDRQLLLTPQLMFTHPTTGKTTHRRTTG